MDEQKECQTEYLTVEELSERIKFSKQTLYNMISKGEFILQEHYLKPRPKKILFKWSAIEEWMENASSKSNPKRNSIQGSSLKEKSLINI
jgi:excisionase family DNA binding protein